MSLGKKWVVAAAALAQLAAGCVSLSMLQTARAVPDGTLRGGLGMTMGLQNPPGDGSTTSFLVPVPEVALRYGIGGGRDLGVKAGPLGAQFDLKQQVVDAGGVVLALAPTVGFINGSNTTANGTGSSSTSSQYLLNLQLPVLLGLDLPGGHQLILGPRLAELVTGTSSSSPGSKGTTQAATLLGGGVGVAFKVSSGLRVLPELNATTKVAGDGQNGGSGLQFGVGFLFGP